MSTTTTTYPTDAAWDYFMLHHDDIRGCCERFLPSSRGQSMMSSFPMKPRTIDEFDAAVRARDGAKLVDLMNLAWVKAPESRDVYRIPGFTEMCDLLDCTVEGFVDSGAGYIEEDDEPAF